jgi:hypothetical protein
VVMLPSACGRRCAKRHWNSGHFKRLLSIGLRLN